MSPAPKRNEPTGKVDDRLSSARRPEAPHLLIQFRRLIELAATYQLPIGELDASRAALAQLEAAAGVITAEVNALAAIRWALNVTDDFESCDWAATLAERQIEVTGRALDNMLELLTGLRHGSFDERRPE